VRRPDQQCREHRDGEAGQADGRIGRGIAKNQLAAEAALASDFFRASRIEDI